MDGRTVFRGDVMHVPLDRVELRCTICGQRATVQSPQPDIAYSICDCPDYLEIIDYRATLPDGTVVGPRWGELPKPWVNP